MSLIEVFLGSGFGTSSSHGSPAKAALLSQLGPLQGVQRLCLQPSLRRMQSDGRCCRSGVSHLLAASVRLPMVQGAAGQPGGSGKSHCKRLVP